MEFNVMHSRIPTLKQAESSFQRYRNPLNEFHNKSESNSFEHKQGEFHIPINQYMFLPSTPIYPILGEQKFEILDQTNFFHKNNNQVELNKTEKEVEYKLNLTTFGCKKTCQIDCLLVERYFNQKYWIFQNANQCYKLDQSYKNNADWLKERLQYRYKPQIYEVFVEMIEGILNEGQLQMNARKEPIKLTNQKVFQNLERQISKGVKQDKTFDSFLFEIQKVIAEFIFTKLN
ncbi:unnamed protein product [Paramecium pentaurelia]|uniref:Uncharacterized protein n=1 Tax=Paramecium pentaurelia TaxID=43138 RepID=A0A8S1VTU2_9CILI|nr:unnamed protein product [Paramecium pentaurelia]